MTTRAILTTLAAIGLAAVLHSSALASVVAHYRFDTDYTDSSANGNDGTLIEDDAPSSTPGNSGITNVAGQSVFGGGAVNFSADRDRVEIPPQIFNDGIPWSVSFWAKQDGGNNEGMVIGQADVGTQFIWLYGSSSLRWRGNSSANQRDFTVAKGNTWHHYLLVAEAADNDNSVNDITLYFDGSLVGTGKDTPTRFVFDDIGEAYGTNLDLDFVGQIDEVWIFDESLNGANAVLLYQTNRPVPEPSGVILAAIGLAVLGGLGRRRRR